MRASLDKHYRCGVCDYSLHGLESGRCPECGAAFDLFDPESLNRLGRPIGKYERLLLRPPLWVWWVAGTALLLYQFWQSRWPGGASRDDQARFGFLWFAWCASFVGIAVWRQLWICREHPRRLWRGGMRRWQFLAAFVLVAILASSTSVCWRLAVLMSSPSFGRLERQMLAAPPANRTGPFWVGLFPVKRAHNGGRYVVFEIGDGLHVATMARPDWRRFYGEQALVHCAGWSFAKWSLGVRGASAVRGDMLRRQLDDSASPRVPLEAAVASLGEREFAEQTGTSYYTMTGRPGHTQISAWPFAWRLRPDLLVLEQRFREATEALRKGLRSGDSLTQQQICHLLVRRGRDVPELAGDVVQLLANRDARVRDAAACALISMPEAVRQHTSAVGKALGDSAPAVRYNAATAIRKSHSTATSVVPLLVDALQQAKKRTTTEMALDAILHGDDPQYFTPDMEVWSVLLLAETLADYRADAAVAMPLLRELAASPQLLVRISDTDRRLSRGPSELEEKRARRARVLESGLRNVLLKMEGKAPVEAARRVAPAEPFDQGTLRTADDVYRAAVEKGIPVRATIVAPFRRELCQRLTKEWSSIAETDRPRLAHLLKRLGPEALPLAARLPPYGSTESTSRAVMGLLQLWKDDWRKINEHVGEWFRIDGDIEEMVLAEPRWRNDYVRLVASLGERQGPGLYEADLAARCQRMARLATEESRHSLRPVMEAWVRETADLTARQRAIEALAAVNEVLEGSSSR